MATVKKTTVKKAAAKKEPSAEKKQEADNKAAEDAYQGDAVNTAVYEPTVTPVPVIPE